MSSFGGKKSSYKSKKAVKLFAQANWLNKHRNLERKERNLISFYSIAI